MKNVTISMDDAQLARARAEAGKAGLSVSRWVADQLRQSEPVADLETAMLAVFQTPLTPMSDGGRAFVREELYDRRFMKRFR